MGNTCKSYIKKFQIIENKCLRMAINAKPGTNTTDLHKKLNFSTIPQLINITTRIFYEEQLNLV